MYLLLDELAYVSSCGITPVVAVDGGQRHSPHPDKNSRVSAKRNFQGCFQAFFAREREKNSQGYFLGVFHMIFRGPRKKFDRFSARGRVIFWGPEKNSARFSARGGGDFSGPRKKFRAKSALNKDV